MLKIGKLPVIFLLDAYYSVVKPEFGAERKLQHHEAAIRRRWQLRSQETLIF